MTSSRRPATSTTTRSRGASVLRLGGGAAARRRWSFSNSVSIQRVCTVKGPSGCCGANAGSRTTARWNGSTVGMPSTSNSASARRARSSAWVRSRPVTISLASIESNAPPMTIPGRRRSRSARPARPAGADRDRPGLGQEVAAGVLAVDPELDGVAARRRVVVADRLARGDPQLLAHQVDAGDLLGDRVLHLQPGVHLEERDGAVRADEELAGARADVAGLAQDRLGRPVQLGVLLRAEEGRRGLLDELLVAALQRAVAGGDDDHVAVRVGQALRLDVAGLVEVPLDEALAAAEGGDRLADRRLEQLGDLLGAAGHLQPAPAAAEGRLDRDRQAVLVRRRRPPRRRR